MDRSSLFIENIGISGAKLGQIIADSYLKSSFSYEPDFTGAFSVINLSAAKKVYAALNNFLKYELEVCKNNDLKALYYYKFSGCLNKKLSEYIAKKGLNPVKKNYGRKT